MNSEFSFSSTSYLTEAEEPSLPYYLPIAGGRIIGFIPFPRVLVLCEMQSVSSRIWTRVAVSISYDDNHYTTGTSIHIHFIVWYHRDSISVSIKMKMQWGVETKVYENFADEMIWFGFMVYQPLTAIWCQIHLYTYKQFNFKQFSLT